MNAQGSIPFRQFENVFSSIIDACEVHATESEGVDEVRSKLNEVMTRLEGVDWNLRNEAELAAWSFASRVGREMFLWGWRLRDNPSLLMTLISDNL